MRAEIQAGSSSMFQARSCSRSRPVCFYSRWLFRCCVDANRSVRAISGPARLLNPESSSGRKKRLAGTELGQSSPLTHQHHFDGVQVSNAPLQNLAKRDQGHLVCRWNTVSWLIQQTQMQHAYQRTCLQSEFTRKFRKLSKTCFC